MSESRKTPKFSILFLLLFTTVVVVVFNIYNTAWAQTGTVTATVKIIVCGNDIKEGDEQCDGSDLAGKTCQDFGFTQGDLGCGSACDEFDTSACYTSSAPPSGGGGVAPTETKVILKGKAYPDSLVTVLKDGKIVTVRRVDSRANFEAEITDLTAGIYTFGLWAKDKNGIKSITYTLTFRVLTNTTITISGIFLPPTIDLDKTSLQKGEILNIFGQTVPEVEVDVHIFSSEIIKQVQTDEIGAWLLAFDTQPLEEGLHITKARFNLSEEERSGFSGLLTFYIGEEGLPEEFCPRADLNKDGKTNLVDFSILLYWWGKSNVSVDQNRNGIVDLPDFSIMMYYWTG